MSPIRRPCVVHDCLNYGECSFRGSMRILIVVRSRFFRLARASRNKMSSARCKGEDQQSHLLEQRILKQSDIVDCQFWGFQPVHCQYFELSATSKCSWSVEVARAITR